MLIWLTSSSILSCRQKCRPLRPNRGVDAPVNKDVVLTPEEAAIWTYGPEAIGKLNRVDYGKLNAAKVDWIDRWNEIFGS